LTRNVQLPGTNNLNAPAAVSEHPGGVTIKVYVAPRSSATGVIGMHDGEIKVALTAPPVDGAANKALVEFLAKKLGIPKSAVSLVSGETSRHKVVAVADVDAETLLRKLELHVSQA
jgi:uncharacterized protein (TIGR00251 family)